MLLVVESVSTHVHVACNPALVGCTMYAYYQKLAQSLNEQINDIWLMHVKKTKYDTVVQYWLIFCMFS